MKQLTDAELKDFAVSLLDKQGLGQYEQFIEEHEQKMKQDCRNVPAECEDVGCRDCPFDPNAQVSRGCPYVD